MRSRSKALSAAAFLGVASMVATMLGGATAASGSTARGDDRFVGGPGGDYIYSGIIVSGAIRPSGQFEAVFRATPSMQESEIAVSRQGATITVLELEGGPSMSVEPNLPAGVFCSGNNPSGLSDVVQCTFQGATQTSGLGVVGVFADAPRGVTFAIEPRSQIYSRVLGSAFDDYIQGGPLTDTISGNAGDDFIFGAGGADVLNGGAGDDVIYGEGDEEEDLPSGLPGHDYISGGPGDDVIDAGLGSDYVLGGAGNDDIDVRDGVTDSRVFCADDPNAREQDEIKYDLKLDQPILCGVTQVPSPTTWVSMYPTSLVKPGTKLNGGAMTWLGSTPMKYAYRWESCQVDAEFTPRACQDRATGTLTASGLDSTTQKPPSYTVTNADRGRAIRYVAIADNRKLRGGARIEAASTFTNVIAPLNSITILPGALPQQQGKKWTFAKQADVVAAIQQSEIGPWSSVSVRGWPKAAVPKTMRKVIRDGDVFSILVNGRAVPAGTIVEAAQDQRVSLEVRYFSALEQRKTCPASDTDIDIINSWAQQSAVDLTWVTDALDRLKCSWSLVDSGRTGSVPRFTIESIRVGESPDEDSSAAELIITTRRPDLSGQLALAVGAPPNSIVAQSPDHFTIGSAGALYAFPGTVFTSLWVNLIGDQARIPTKRARMELFLNGRLKAKQELSGDFSSMPATVLTETGTLRIVVTTLENNGTTVRAQVYADFEVRDPASAPLEDLITFDGRCFSRTGALQSACMDRAPGPRVLAIRDVLSVSNSAQLATYGAVDALRVASARLDKRFTPIVVNSVLSDVLRSTPGTRATGPRSAGCAWWNLPCQIGAVTAQVVNAIIRPKPTPQAPKPIPVAYRAKAPTTTVTATSAVPAVTSGDVAELPGVGLIGLDGASLIGLDGASLLSDQAGSLIGLDNASLIGLDNASLIGLDGASLIGLDAASAQSDTVRLPTLAAELISAGGLG
jgi:hypothetical protein